MAIETQKKTTTPKSILKYILKCKSYIGPWLPQQPATILGRCQFGAPFQRFPNTVRKPCCFHRWVACKTDGKTSEMVASCSLMLAQWFAWLFFFPDDHTILMDPSGNQT